MIRIMALILTTTGISLLAYSDGVTVRSTTLSAVLIASASAAGSAVYKVMFKKVMGCVTFSQVTKTKMAYNRDLSKSFSQLFLYFKDIFKF